jgi:hypothetical protein
MTRPFEGIRIIDATHVLAGPFAAYQLGLLGADVIKIEHPDDPDQSRINGSDMSLNEAGMGCQYLTQGSNKRSLTLDLKPHYRLERMGISETDQTGRPITRLETSRTPDTTNQNYWEDFVFDELWTLHRNNEFAERMEANIRYQVLAFPIRQGRQWDGNAFNTRNTGPDQQLYSYVNTDTTVTVAGRTYQNCVFVKQRKSKTLLFDVDTYEVYAPGVGLIKRYDRSIIYDDVNLTSLTTDSYIRIYSIVAHN